ncbi:hypothetical protein R5R35_014403 [Gryllus longicercus]|uniref:Uncharacterized protein n=1 Tax=Gryllus longicercus TaxID=2509291 RepID=A0AAN9WEE1_9ORTH
MSNVQTEVRRLLEETLQIQKTAEEIIDKMMNEFLQQLPTERERALRREAVCRRRLHVEDLQEKCWRNIQQCYQLLRGDVDTPENSCSNTSRTAGGLLCVTAPPVAAAASPSLAAVTTPPTAAVASPSRAAVTAPPVAAASSPSLAAVAAPPTAAAASPSLAAVTAPSHVAATSPSLAPPPSVAAVPAQTITRDTTFFAATAMRSHEPVAGSFGPPIREKSPPSFVDPERFRCNPSRPKSPSCSHEFGSTN